MEDGIFIYCTSLTSVTIPNSVTSIGISAFNNCSSLTSVTIPNSVTNIDDDAFLNCISLQDVTIPNSVTSLGAFCFAGCSALTEIIIGNSVDKIEEGTFRGCNSMNKITSLNPTPPSCNVFSFYRDGDENKDIYSSIVYVPAGSKEAYSTAYVWQDFSNIVEME